MVEELESERPASVFLAACSWTDSKVKVAGLGGWRLRFKMTNVYKQLDLLMVWRHPSGTSECAGLIYGRHMQ